MPEAWIKDIDAVVASAARHYPLPVAFRGEDLDRQDFLAGACRIEDWQGCRIGVFHDRIWLPAVHPRINFHGLTVSCSMPGICEVKDNETWHVRVDIVDAPALQLVLPARKEMVQNAALEDLREAAERAIFRAIAAMDGHRLTFAQWQRASELGVDLPEADAWLSGWLPRTADGDGYYLGERVAETPKILFPDDDTASEQCAARVLGTGQALGGTLVREVREFEGYGWYDGLPRISSLSFLVDTEEGLFRFDSGNPLPDTLQSGRVRSIHLDLTVSRSREPHNDAQSHSLAADVLVAPEVSWSTDLDQAVILLSPDCAIDPMDLAVLLEAVCFCACDDVDCDSWDTQQSDYMRCARQIAHSLLLGEQAAIIDRIQGIVADEIIWSVPKDKQMSIHVAAGKVEVAIAEWSKDLCIGTS